MSAGQREEAENILRYDDIPYGTESKWQRLDVYRPKKVNGKLPVIVSVHGGGWVYGDMLRNYLVNDEERTILITSHIASDLETLCDDIYLIHDGRITVHEETDTLMEEYGILKVSNGQFESLDKEYLIKSQKENYGYACFTANKKFYQENYPGIQAVNSDIHGTCADNGNDPEQYIYNGISAVLYGNFCYQPDLI